MLMIRLARFGAKKKPFYRIVVIEKERARNGRNLEVVGHYNPLTTPAQVVLKHEGRRGSRHATSAPLPADVDVSGVVDVQPACHESDSRPRNRRRTICIRPR